MKNLILSCLALGLAASLSAQKLAVKNNLLYDAALTPNLAVEFGLGQRTTLEVGAQYNWFTLADNKKWKHWLVQPEFRLWCCERFNGSFFGIHALGGEANIGNVELPFGIFPGLKDVRREGWFAGAGVTYGHQWILGKRWNLEASVGVGYVYAEYDRYACQTCGDYLGKGTKNYFGPTRAAISIAYFIR